MACSEQHGKVHIVDPARMLVDFVQRCGVATACDIGTGTRRKACSDAATLLAIGIAAGECTSTGLVATEEVAQGGRQLRAEAAQTRGCSEKN